ncbi:hypothetical protein SprV_0501771700 [Sparganum proliferum]
MNAVLPFLDIQVSRQEDGTLQTGVFRKATDTEKILHYNSNHPLSHKRSCVRTLFRRIHTHCSTEAEKLRERKTLWHLFLANGYPRSFVNKCLYRRHTKTDGEKRQRQEIFRVLPYVRNVSEATERMLRPLNVGVGHRPEATIRRLIMQPKDRLPPAETSGVIYRVKCLDCLANYCGMTEKRLRTRMHDHTLAVRRKDVRSHVAMHCLENNYKLNFDSAHLVGRADSKLAREVIEAWKSDANSINYNLANDKNFQDSADDKKSSSTLNNHTVDDDIIWEPAYHGNQMKHWHPEAEGQALQYIIREHKHQHRHQPRVLVFKGGEREKSYQVIVGEEDYVLKDKDDKKILTFRYLSELASALKMTGIEIGEPVSRKGDPIVRKTDMERHEGFQNFRKNLEDFTLEEEKLGEGNFGKVKVGELKGKHRVDPNEDFRVIYKVPPNYPK